MGVAMNRRRPKIQKNRSRQAAIITSKPQE
jgi:hypothetical protein